MSKHDYLNDNWDDPLIRKAEKILRNEHFAKDDADNARWDREVLTPLAAGLKAEADEADQRTAELLAQYDRDWNGALSKWGVIPSRNANQTRRDVVCLPDGRSVWLNPSTHCIEEV